MFDAHFHIVSPDFPLVANDGYLPPPFSVRDYLVAVEGLGASGGALVSGSFQGFDQAYLEEALGTLGPRYVGVTQLPEHTPDSEILRLDGLGVRAVRVNLRRGGSAGLSSIATFGRRVHEVAGWHTELYVDAKELPSIAPALGDLPRLGIDHLGLSAGGLPHLVRFVEAGGFVKASGFGRLDFDPITAIRSLLSINPEAVMFGTDLPSTRSPRPFARSDAQRILESLDSVDAQRVLEDNARRIYRIDG